MWIRLENDEIALILQSIPDGPLAVKLKAKPDTDQAAFVAAVVQSDELEVDDDAVVSQGEDGAFVMSWAWVSNSQAGIDKSEVYDEVVTSNLLVR